MLKLERYKYILTKRLINLTTRNASASQPTLDKSFKQQNVQKSRNLLDFNFSTSNLSRNQMRQINSEYSAILRLLSRSFNVPQHLIARSLSTTALNLCSKQNPDKSDKPEKKKDDVKPPNYRSDGRHDEDDDNKKKGEDEEKLLSVLTKSILWMVSLIFSN